MPRRFKLFCIVSVFTGAALATPIQASALPRNSNNSHGLPSAEAGSFTTKAKVAYYYSRGGGADTSKNVAQFTHPSTGVFCITPSVALGYPNVYPHVTVDWGNSIGNTLFAYILLHSDDCANGPFEVLTYDGTGNRSNNVSFIFSLP